jgi:hypothetical protein
MNTPVIDPIHDLMTTNVHPKGSQTMLIYENLARERMREAEQAASHARLVRRLNSAKRWDRLTAWAARHARRAHDRL